MKIMVLRIWRIIPKISKVGVSNLFTLEKGNIFPKTFPNLLEMTKFCWKKITKH